MHLRLRLSVILLCAAAVSTAAAPYPEQPAQKPVRSKSIRSSGGPGTPATLDGLWNLADMVALVEVASASPHNTSIVTQQGTPFTDVQTLFACNLIETFKSPDAQPPTSVDILLLGGTRDRGDHIEETTNERLRPLRVGSRYVVFLRHFPDLRVFKPITADANSFLRVNGAAITSDGDSPLVLKLKGQPLDSVLSELRRLKGGR